MSSKDDPNFSLFGDDALAPVPASPFPAREPHPEPAPRAAAPPPPPVKPNAPTAPPSSGGYDASSIEVLEGLEPVRMRPGMYIGGTDERALHHLFAEVLDNSMDEAVAGFAKTIEVKLDADGYLSVRDDGRGMPVDEHPKHPGKSALEVIMTVLHAGGKFSGKAYETSGGLHGVGASVVNALSELVEVTVWRDGFEHRQSFARGKPLGPVEKIQPSKKRGTQVRFKPDDQIFGEGCGFKPARLYRMARSKAYLFRGVQIKWSCDASRIHDQTPAEATFHFPNGLADFLAERTKGLETGHARQLLGPHRAPGRGRRGRVGHRLDPARLRRARRLHAVVLQHRAHPRGRHPRKRPARRPDPRAEGLCRAEGREAGDDHHRRRRHRPGRGPDLGVHQEPGIPGPDQGKAVVERGPALRRERPARPVRPLADRQPQGRPGPAGVRDRAGRGTPQAPQGQGSQPRLRDPQAAPAGQAGRLRGRGRRRGRAVHRRRRLGRRLGQAGSQPQEPGDPAPARQDPQRGLGQRREVHGQQGTVAT
jgi:hypothetical protein